MWTGVYTADPRLVPTAKKLKAITYDEMLDLAALGAGVLHNRSVEMAKKYGVQLVVRSSLNESEGTVVKEVVKKVERMLISGVALDENADRISVIGIKDQPEARSSCSIRWQREISMWTLSSSPLEERERRISPLR